MIVPYLNLINEETKNLNPNTVNSSWYHNIPKGAKNGLQNGLKLVLDVESFDYAYFPRGAKGFRVAIANALDQAVVNQDGFYIAPGLKEEIMPLSNQFFDKKYVKTAWTFIFREDNYDYWIQWFLTWGTRTPRKRNKPEGICQKSLSSY